MKRLPLPLAVALLGVAAILLMQFAIAPSDHGVYKHVPNGPEKTANKPAPTSAPIMQICISLIVLGAGLWIVLSQQYQPQEKHWAYGAIGTIIGFWLRG